MILLSHPTGNEFVRHALTAFDEAGMLGEFWTTLSWNEQNRVHQLLPGSLQQLFARRSYPAVIRDRTHIVSMREIGRLLAGAFSIDNVNVDLDAKVAARLRSPWRVRHSPDSDNLAVVYAYEDVALETFRAAQERGMHRVYDLPIGYWRAAQRIFSEEAEFQPEWASTLTGTKDSREKLDRKDEELWLAERIVVASTFTKKTLTETPGGPCLNPLPVGEEGPPSPSYALASAKRQAKIDVIPYGAPLAVAPGIRKPNGVLKILFAGSLGQRKGISYLLEAVGLLKGSVELTLLGRKAAHDCRPLEAATRRHRWIPTLNHAGVLREMHEHDLLVFPSLFEGFGLVVLEAMAQGTPVITTEHTCGPDIIENDVDGFIVSIRSPEAIAEKIDLLNSDRERLMSMKQAARCKAEACPWKIYQERLVKMAREVVAE
jgi:glycosyltransferase involved in cell wall biosynthesis